MPMPVAKSSSPAPDWERVPFDVNCARCGHDLRGLQDPKCPGCALSFDWSEAVPIEELICEQCDYHLFGLTENRCPECGRPFTWPEALAAHQRRRIPLFEHQWPKKPVRSFFTSMYRALHPRRLWTAASLHDRPRVGPLIYMALASIALAATGVSVFLFIEAWTLPRSLQASLPWKTALLIERVPFALEVALRNARLTLVLFVVPVLCWTAFSFVALMVFRQSMRIYRVRFAHVVRVWVYAVPASIVCMTTTLAAVMAFASIADYLLPAGVGEALDYVVALNWAIAFLFYWQVIWSLRCGYRHYMRMDNAFWVAIASQVIAILATATLLDTVSFF